MLFRLTAFAVLALALMTGGARAQEYSDASWTNMLRTLVRFNALDMSDQMLLDEHGFAVEQIDVLVGHFAVHQEWHAHFLRHNLRKSRKVPLPLVSQTEIYDRFAAGLDAHRGRLEAWQPE